MFFPPNHIVFSFFALSITAHAQSQHHSTTILRANVTANDHTAPALAHAHQQDPYGPTYPLFGLGTASGVRKHHVSAALDQGYSFFDTASAYRWGYQEHEVGEAVSEWVARRAKRPAGKTLSATGAGGTTSTSASSRVAARKTLFLQSKVDPEYFETADHAFNNIKKSLKNFAPKNAPLSDGTTYLDCVLLHFPMTGWETAWAVLQLFAAAGVVRHIGVSNFDAAHLRQVGEELVGQEVEHHTLKWPWVLEKMTELRREFGGGPARAGRGRGSGRRTEGDDENGPGWFLDKPVVTEEELLQIDQERRLAEAALLHGDGGNAHRYFF